MISKTSIHYILILLLGLFSFSEIIAQDASSNLPIVIIDTGLDNNNIPYPIPDEPKIEARMKIIKRPDGSRNYITDIDNNDYLNYNGKIKIELRGSSSQALDKKQYGFTTILEDGENNNVSLLGMPEENDWILNGFAFDTSFMRDYLAYNIARQMGQYASRAEYCEVIINGDYRGLYILSEKIKADGDRVNIVKIGSNDNSSIALTGGYITKADKTTGGDPVAWTMNNNGVSTDFIHELPKPSAVTSEQNQYIESVFRALESNATSADIADGYPSVIDVPSFIDYMIVAEISSNVDVYEFSTFFHKDRGGKLRAGPVWDYNFSFGVDGVYDYENRSKTDVWQFNSTNKTGARFWKDLFNNDTYKCYFKKRINELSQANHPLNNSTLFDFIDQISDLISEALDREHARWETSPDHEAHINLLKSWYEARMLWINSQLESVNSDCYTINTPSLVISKIHYNPSTSGEFTVSNDLEFIEITNTGESNVLLTGIYLRELGVNYQFPKNSTLASGKSLYLASNANTFTLKHGFPPFGEFARNLPNSNHNLILADAFGNIIDQVHYKDKSPWPQDADGDGYWLELIDHQEDNNHHSNWQAAEERILELTDNNYQSNSSSPFLVFPNPSHDVLFIKSATTIDKVELHDKVGKVLMTKEINDNSASLDISSFNNGMYILKISGKGSTSIEKILKY